MSVKAQALPKRNKTMANKIAQRARKPNYTKEETEMLLDQLILYGHFLFNKTQLVNNQQKADVWGNIAMQVNSVPNSAGRTVDELKHRWQDMAQRARAVIRKSQSGSPNDKTKVFPLRPVPFLDKILQVLGECQKDSGRRPEDSALTSHDSTYSSDSSCANETKLGIKEEQHIDQDAVVDLSQSNGSKSSNSLKRSLDESIDLTSKTSSSETNITSTPNHERLTVSSSSSLPAGIDQGSLKSIYFNQNQTEPKRRKTRDGSPPCNPVIEQNHILSLLNGQRGGRHHPVESSSRSMVLDPESQLVMEVEDFGGDGRSGSTSRSASIHEEDHEYDSLNNGAENTKVSEGVLHHPLQATPTFPVHPFMTAANNPNLRSILSGNRALPSQPPVGMSNPFMTATLYPPTGTGSQMPHVFSHSHFHPLSHSQLESLPKLELERHCIISQIRMQDQRTKYFLLKEKKLQMEIELLREKCYCNRSSSCGGGGDGVKENSPSCSPADKDGFCSNRISDNSNSLSPPCQNLPVSLSESPCHLSISEVTSCHSIGFQLDNSEQRELSRPPEQNEIPQLNTPGPVDLVSQDSMPPKRKSPRAEKRKMGENDSAANGGGKNKEDDCESENVGDLNNGVEGEEEEEEEEKGESQSQLMQAKSATESKPGDAVTGLQEEINL